MVKFLRIVAWLVVVGLVALLAFIFIPPVATKPTEELAADWQPEPGQGKAVFDAGDCVACHTAPDRPELAGGRAIVSPMGTIWSTNITPDKDTGIGNWSLDEFRAAMVDGVAPGGKHLYPAMPYENYRLMSERDIRALYQYLMTDVPAVKNEVQETKLSFPFNMRFGIRAWNWLALRHGPGFTPANTDTVQARGQYLIEAAGHCAACHSPRNAMMMQDGVTANEPSFLSGGVIDGWNAPALLGEGSDLKNWSVEDVATYLSTGRNSHSTANGEMGLVVEHSLQYLSDADLLAMASFLKGETAPDTTPIAPAGPIAHPNVDANAKGKSTAELLTAADPSLPLGAQLYLDNCSACHFVTGRGADGIFPALQDNPLVVGSEVHPLLSIILNGATVAGTEKRPMDLVMQGYADRLSDSEVAELATFLRSAWGNDAPAVTAEQVGAVRAETKPE